ncbi:hypothetical protein BCR32DRAFT_270988 [Anaeromyces robustus]|uniref:Uncharacterized protein n=1 Tax=Anaeromyces robustus TaxID=1754192 RepID=A0A1Y1WTY9_9FUNG|nr:hypothetical protein BCR32DRAFT_270988 [Anaeromyces robustus]|eukprot:ORX76875.1 hypothetical protein BCR32DRAFT_270988 [Anaeromyces robustus]
MEEEQWNYNTNDLKRDSTSNHLKDKLINHDFLEGKDFLLTNYIKDNFFLKNKNSFTYDNTNDYKFNIPGYSIESLSDGTYVSDDQLSAITIISSTNDDTEAESKHDIFLIDDYSNHSLDNFNHSESEFITHQLFDINNQSLNEDYKERDNISNNINNEIANNSSILKEHSISNSFFLNLNKGDYNQFVKDDFLDIGLICNKEKDNDEQHSIKSNYGISEDTYINSDNSDNSPKRDCYLDNHFSMLDYDEDHYQHLKNEDSKFYPCSSDCNNNKYILSNLYNDELNNICSVKNSDIDPHHTYGEINEIEEGIGEEEEDNDEEEDIEIIIASESPTPPPLFYKKMAEIRKSKKSLINIENENSNEKNNAFSSNKRHKKHKYNRNNHSKNNKNSKSSSHCEPSTISIEDYIDHSTNLIFSNNNSNNNNKKKKTNNKHFNLKSKNSSSYISVNNFNNSNSKSNTNSMNSKSINHAPNRDENNELSSSWPSLASLYLSNNNNSNSKVNKKENEVKINVNSSLTSVKDKVLSNNVPSTSALQSQDSHSNNNKKNSSKLYSLSGKFSYLSLLSNINSSFHMNTNSSTPFVKIKENSSNYNNHYNHNIFENNDNDENHDTNNNNEEIPLSNEKDKIVDYFFASKKSTTCITSINSSLFLVNCPNSVKNTSSKLKSFNFFAQDDLLEDNISEEDHNNNNSCNNNNDDFLSDIKKDSIILDSFPKKSNLTHSLSQSNLVYQNETNSSNNISLIGTSSSPSTLTISSTNSSPLFDSTLAFSVSSNSSSTVNSTSLSIPSLENIPYHYSENQIIIPSPSLSNSHIDDIDKSVIFCHNDGSEHDMTFYKNDLNISSLPVSSSSQKSNIEYVEIHETATIAYEQISNRHSHSDTSVDDKISYSLESTKNSILEEKKLNKLKNECNCHCNQHNHYCSFIDHQFRLNREKRRLIKSAINCGFTGVHLKDDLNSCYDDDENISNCDSTSHSIYSRYKNKEEENEKEDIINTILLSHTEFSTFPIHLKFTINTHDVWVKWTNLEFNKDRFKDGYLL